MPFLPWTGGGTTGVALLNAQNHFTQGQFLNPAVGSNVTPLVFQGRNGAYVMGLDGAATIPSRDWAFGRVEQFVTGDNTDDFYTQNNAQTATLTAPVTAGATTLLISAALTFTGSDGGGAFWVLLGDNTPGNSQETVQITAGRGTTTMTCPPLANPHPTGALVTVGYDNAHQSTFEFFRVGNAASSNQNWRVTIRPDVTLSQPTLGGLKIEVPPSAGLTADYMEIGSRDESTKTYRIQTDGSIMNESVPTDFTDPAGATTLSSTTLQLSITPSDKMYGCMMACPGVPRGAWITAINVGLKQVTLSIAATATASGLAVTIYKPIFQVRQDVFNNFKPWLTVNSAGLTYKGKVAVGSLGGTSGGGAGAPNVDLVVNGSSILLDGGGAFGQLQLSVNSSSQALIQPWGVTAITMNISSGNPTIGFYTAAPVLQPNTTGTTAGFTAGAGTTVVSGSTFTGNTGATAYTIGDIVNALKRLGLVAA